MHLAIDLDNTLADTLNTCLTRFGDLSGKQVAAEDCREYSYFRLFGWDEERFRRIYAVHGEEIHWDSPPYPGAVDTMRRLAADHRISIITARPSRFAELSVRWLRHHQIPFQAISFNPDKVGACETMGADLLVDDTPWYADEFAALGRRMILVDHPYNRHVEHILVRRVRDWAEIEHVVALWPQEPPAPAT